MSINGNSPFLYPNVTTIPGSGGVGGARDGDGIRKPGSQGPGEFDRALDEAIGKTGESGRTEGGRKLGGSIELGQLRQPLKFSAHAAQRLAERNIRLDAATLGRVSDAVDKAAAKGVEDSLVLTGDAALIVNVKNRTVITAMDRTQLQGNVFTNIDGAVIV